MLLAVGAAVGVHPGVSHVRALARSAQGVRALRCQGHRVRRSNCCKTAATTCPRARPMVFGHHFTSIAGTGPIVGPAIAVMWGWLPALLWVVFGSIFIGAVHDFGSPGGEPAAQAASTVGRDRGEGDPPAGCARCSCWHAVAGAGDHPGDLWAGDRGGVPAVPACDRAVLCMQIPLAVVDRAVAAQARGRAHGR